MKRYLLFKYYFEQPDGGWNDFEDSFNSLDAALHATNDIDDSEFGWHIVDLETMKIVDSFDY